MCVHMSEVQGTSFGIPFSALPHGFRRQNSDHQSLPLSALVLCFSKREADLHLLMVFIHYTLACILKPEQFF